MRCRAASVIGEKSEAAGKASPDTAMIWARTKQTRAAPKWSIVQREIAELNMVILMPDLGSGS
jgi:hypothetical protein